MTMKRSVPYDRRTKEDPGGARKEVHEVHVRSGGHGGGRLHLLLREMRDLLQRLRFPHRRPEDPEKGRPDRGGVQRQGRHGQIRGDLPAGGSAAADGEAGGGAGRGSGQPLYPLSLWPGGARRGRGGAAAPADRGERRPVFVHGQRGEGRESAPAQLRQGHRRGRALFLSEYKMAGESGLHAGGHALRHRGRAPAAGDHHPL